MTIPTVRPGSTAIRFYLDWTPSGGPVAKRAVIGLDSGIEYSRLGPYRLKLSVSGPSSVRKGETITLKAKVVDVGDRGVHGLTLEVLHEESLLRLVSHTRLSLPSLQAHHSVGFTLTFRGLKKGTDVLNISANAQGGGDVVNYPVRITG